MAELEFHERAKVFADALLANRTAAILQRLAATTEERPGLTAEEVDVLRRAIELTHSCETGLSATKDSPGETGFLDWMESLKAYETAFSAMIRAQLIHAPDDISKILTVAKTALEQLARGNRPQKIREAVEFFQSLCEVNLEVAVDSTLSAPQELVRPEELLSAAT
jgi:hypothetical protein